MRAIIAGVRSLRSEDYYPKGKRWWVRLHDTPLSLSAIIIASNGNIGAMPSQ